MKVHTSTKFVTCQSFVSVSLFVWFFCTKIRLFWHKFMQTYKQVNTLTKSVTCQSFASVSLYVGLFGGFSPPKNRVEDVEIQDPCAEICASWSNLWQIILVTNNLARVVLQAALFYPQKSLVDIQKSPIYPQKSPVHLQKSPMYSQR